MSVGRAAAASLAAEEGYAPAAALPQRLLHFVLFITVLTSSLAFIEPSPHDGLMLVLLVMCVAARVPFDRKLAPLLVAADGLAGRRLPCAHPGRRPAADDPVRRHVVLSVPRGNHVRVPVWRRRSGAAFEFSAAATSSRR